jgi:glutamate 5-kinase
MSSRLLLMELIMKELNIVKIGTSSIAEVAATDSWLKLENIKRLGAQIGDLAARTNVIVVTSSARRAGGNWQQVYDTWSTAINQSTSGHLLDEAHLDNGAATALFNSLASDHVAIANANDELLNDHAECYASNDIVAGRLAQLGTKHGFAVRLTMLTDVSGLLTDVLDESSLVGTVDDISSVRHLAGGAGGSWASGGMATKLTAASMVTAVGGEAIIAHADEELASIIGGGVGTVFEAYSHDSYTCCDLRV